MIKRYLLKNDLTVLHVPKKTDSVTVQVLVNVGSNNESKTEAGLAHFLEHMVFEGTKRRATSTLIANEVERYGGEFNAYTTSVRTCFYVKLPKKHFSLAVDVLADILQQPLFRETDIEKQRNIVLKEIDLVNDEPRFYQWILFTRSLYKNHPCRNPTYGDKKVIKTLTKGQLTNFFTTYYTPRNAMVAIVGDVKNPHQLIERQFTFTGGKRIKPLDINEPPSKKQTTTETRATANTYLVLGHKTTPRHHPDSYAMDIITAILGRGQSGWMFDEIRSKHGLAYEVGVQHEAETDHGYLATYLSIDKKNTEKVKRLILQQYHRLRNVNAKEIQEAKDYIEGSYLLENEDTQKLADTLLFWEQVKDANEMQRFLTRMRMISAADVRHAAKKYLNHNYTIAIIKSNHSS